MLKLKGQIKIGCALFTALAVVVSVVTASAALTF